MIASANIVDMNIDDYKNYGDFVRILMHNLHDGEYNKVGQLKKFFNEYSDDRFPVNLDYNDIFKVTYARNYIRLMQMVLDSQYPVEYSMEAMRTYLRTSIGMDSIMWSPPDIL